MIATASIPTVFGADYSVYVRVVRLALAEKSIHYQLVPVDIFAEGGPDPFYLESHPFGRIPAFEHDGFRLYETSAIARYIDEAFPGVSLLPGNTRGRARCNQLISIADSYVYPHMVWGIYVERISKPQRGDVSDEGKIATSIPVAQTCLKAISDLMANSHWLAGESISLADLYAAPMFDYFLMTEEGRALMLNHPNLVSWWSRMSQRQSMLLTKPT